MYSTYTGMYTHVHNVTIEHCYNTYTLEVVLWNKRIKIFSPRFWPEHIRQRVNSTYTYFAGGLGVTSIAAYAATRASSVMRFMAGRPVAVRESPLFCT